MLLRVICIWFVSFLYAAGWSEMRRMRLARSPSSDSMIRRPLTTAVTPIADLKPLTVCCGRGVIWGRSHRTAVVIARTIAPPI